MPYKDPEKRREYIKLWKKRNPGKQSEYRRLWNERNSEYKRQLLLRRKENFPGAPWWVLCGYASFESYRKNQAIQSTKKVRDHDLDRLYNAHGRTKKKQKYGVTNVYGNGAVYLSFVSDLAERRKLEKLKSRWAMFWVEHKLPFEEWLAKQEKPEWMA